MHSYIAKHFFIQTSQSIYRAEFPLIHLLILVPFHNDLELLWKSSLVLLSAAVAQLNLKVCGDNEYIHEKKHQLYNSGLKYVQGTTPTV